MSGDFYKEWRANAEIDYYPQLVILWLSTNSWYRSHYSEISTKRDRDYLNKLREDHSTRNKLFARFDKLLKSAGTKAHSDLLNHIEGLFFALNNAILLWDENDSTSAITYEHCIISFNPQKTYGSLLVKSQVPGLSIGTTLRVTNDNSVLFNGFLEIIYQVRCQLVHGQMEPNRENHDVVKHCYFLLRELMSF